MTSQDHIFIYGWNKGFQKVQFTKMLQQELGLSLAFAKSTTDNILEGGRVNLAVGESDYQRVANLATELGALVQTKASAGHPYKQFEDTVTWRRLDTAISDLVQNKDLLENEAREYIVGYLCKALSEGSGE
jgi:hypothetical protein